MGLVYSTYEAEARFSEVIRHVREGKTVTVSCRGEPVAAELRAACAREGFGFSDRLVANLSWVFPDLSLARTPGGSVGP